VGREAGGTGSCDDVALAGSLLPSLKAPYLPRPSPDPQGNRTKMFSAEEMTRRGPTGREKPRSGRHPRVALRSTEGYFHIFPTGRPRLVPALAVERNELKRAGHSCDCPAPTPGAQEQSPKADSNSLRMSCFVVSQSIQEQGPYVLESENKVGLSNEYQYSKHRRNPDHGQRYALGKVDHAHADG